MEKYFKLYYITFTTPPTLRGNQLPSYISRCHGPCLSPNILNITNFQDPLPKINDD